MSAVILPRHSPVREECVAVGIDDHAHSHHSRGSTADATKPSAAERQARPGRLPRAHGLRLRGGLGCCRRGGSATQPPLRRSVARFGGSRRIGRNERAAPRNHGALDRFRSTGAVGPIPCSIARGSRSWCQGPRLAQRCSMVTSPQRSARYSATNRRWQWCAVASLHRSTELSNNANGTRSST